MSDAFCWKYFALSQKNLSKFGHKLLTKCTFCSVTINVLDVMFVVVYLSGSQPAVCEITALELELKGDCQPYCVSIEPTVIAIPGQLYQGTVIKRKFMVCNICLNCTSSRCLNWLLQLQLMLTYCHLYILLHFVLISPCVFWFWSSTLMMQTLSSLVIC